MLPDNPPPAGPSEKPPYPGPASSPRANRLLGDLPEADYERLVPHLKPVPLGRGQVLYRSGEYIRDVYFITDGLVSMIVPPAPGVAPEAFIVARYGLLGMRSIIFGGRTAEQATVQIEGSAFSMPSETFQAEFQRGDALRHQVMRYLQLVFVQVAQYAQCNRLHSAEARLCHWLLTISHRTGEGEFELAQQFLAQALGTRRSEALAAASAIRAKGLIGYTCDSGGIRIRVIDQEGLAASACACYGVIHREFEHLYP